MNLTSNKPTQTDQGSWMISYSDVVTALLAFFVLLMSISSIDQRKIEYIQESIQSDVLKQDYSRPFETLKNDLNQLIDNQNLSNNIDVESTLGLNITFSSSLLYKSGSADVQKSIQPMIKEISQLIQSINYDNILIEVEGHTDDVPINTKQFKSNWELSVIRATNIIQLLISNGIDKQILKASGFADSRPISPNIIDGVPNKKSCNQS